MSYQLLLQTIICSDQNSLSFSDSFASLMEIRNLIEKMNRKYKLLELSEENERLISSSGGNNNHAHYSKNNSGSLNKSLPSSPMNPTKKPLTRSSLSRMQRKKSFNSVFDMGLLGDIQSLFEKID